MEEKVKKLKEFNELVTSSRDKRDIVVYNPDWNCNVNEDFFRINA